MELGLCSFVDTAFDPVTGKAADGATRMKELLEEIHLADQAGLDVFAIGEHHRPDYLASAPAVILAAAAARTSRIRLSSGVTVLSSDDPVRVFESFATLDLISQGRAEIMAGRGSFIESFPLFGYDLKDYDQLFQEKLELLLALRLKTRVSWSGVHRPSLDDRGVYPRPLQDPLPVWIAVGGTPQSVVRAAHLGLPLAIAIIGGSWRQFGPLVDLYRKTATRAGHNPDQLPVGINSHAFLAPTEAEAVSAFWPGYAESMSRIGRERRWPPITRAQFDAGRSLEGSLFVGEVNQVVDKILAQHELFRHQRTLLQMTLGLQSHRDTMQSIALYAERVAPAVRKALGVTGVPRSDQAGGDQAASS